MCQKFIMTVWWLYGGIVGVWFHLKWLQNGFVLVSCWKYKQINTWYYVRVVQQWAFVIVERNNKTFGLLALFLYLFTPYLCSVMDIHLNHAVNSSEDNLSFTVTLYIILISIIYHFALASLSCKSSRMTERKLQVNEMEVVLYANIAILCHV